MNINFNKDISILNIKLMKDYKMNLLDYQRDSKETAVYPQEMAIEYLTLKLAGEAGEVAEAYGKCLRGDYDIDTCRDKVEKELGDVLWYVAQLCTEWDLSLNTIAHKNLDKLQDRKDRGVLKGSGDER